MDKNDPLGNAIWDYHTKNSPQDIVVKSDILDDDTLPVSYLFREYADFPELEVVAMQYCKGKVLDVGAAAGPHSRYLVNNGFDVSTVEISPKAHQYLTKALPQAKHYLSSIFDFNEGKFDTILLLMNGIGLAGTLQGVTPFLKHLVSLLNPEGCILCESTDVLDIFEDEDGGLWVDLASDYYGEFRFDMHYKDTKSGWFNWIYLDRANFQKMAEDVGLQLNFLYNKKDSYLVQLKRKT